LSVNRLLTPYLNVSIRSNIKTGALWAISHMHDAHYIEYAVPGIVY